MNSKHLPIRKQWKVLLPAGILAFGFVAFTLSCSSDSTTVPTESKAWFYESEFADDPGLVARPYQVVILDIMPGEGSTEHAIPYQYEEGGGHLFAIEPGDPFITRAEVFDGSGVMVATMGRGDGGVYLDMTPGSYSIKVYHDGVDVPEEGSVAFIRRQVTPQEATEPDSADMAEETSVIDPVYPAYVVIQFMGGTYDGAYLAATEQSRGNDSLTLLSAQTHIEETSLFSFEKVAIGPCVHGGPLECYSFRSWVYEINFGSFPVLCDWSPEICPPSQDKPPYPNPKATIILQYTDQTGDSPVCIQDVGDGTFIPWANYYSHHCSPIYADDGNQFVYFTAYSTSAAPDSFRILDGVRIYKDASQITKDDLKKGEVALYTEENYRGFVFVLSASFPTNPFIYLLPPIKSLAFGTYTDTTIQFFGETNFSDLIRTVGIDMPGNLDISYMASIKIFDSRKVLISSKKCPYCNLADVDLSNLNLDEADLSYANLKGSNIHHTSLKKANMANAFLNGAQLTYANLSGVSLLDASLNADSDLNLPAATLTGAYLKNANLQGADLGGAIFSNVSFYADTYNQAGCAQDSTNPPFTKNCASAEGANMNATNFTGAYLAGADFSNTTAAGANFSDAILTGAKFTGAKLDWPSSTGSRTNFTGAFIGGADFLNATVEGATFLNAYVNFSPEGDCMLFTVENTHTQFPGFYYKYGDSPCVMFAYSDPTITADTDNNNICPDGSSGPCGTESWTSPLKPRSQSSQPNSSCFDKPPLCDMEHIDPNW